MGFRVRGAKDQGRKRNGKEKGGRRRRTGYSGVRVRSAKKQAGRGMERKRRGEEGGEEGGAGVGGRRKRKYNLRQE